eukprot:TRINITY_DN57978_c0_g1_i1.p1 TRINITY_DN57978_c0_g1~~TRINITY_DN57978_c0_g1_i1.p1  ORF type:complete len:416 (+),score=45.71 TRINITY_DN57978_c0_g1_i1:80-1327(+)
MAPASTVVTAVTRLWLRPQIRVVTLVAVHRKGRGADLCSCVLGSGRRPISNTRSSIGGQCGSGSSSESNSRKSVAVAEVHQVTDPGDPRVVLYRMRNRRDHREYQVQVHALAARALAAEAAAASTDQARKELATRHNQENGGSLRDGSKRVSRASAALSHLDCVVGVHYSWDCLRRLRQAHSAGRRVLLESILVPSCATSSLISLACEIAPIVYVAPLELIREELSKDGSSLHDSCNFVVAYPAQRPLRDLKPPFLILDGVGSSQNVGQILRTAYHLGITSVVASRGAWNNLNGRACRVSMGWLYHMDFHLGEPLSDALHELRARGVSVYAAEEHFSSPVAPHKPCENADWALAVGHEDIGVSAEVAALCDFRICVPQARGESLNVAHAAAICIYELGRHDATRYPAASSVGRLE